MKRVSVSLLITFLLSVSLFSQPGKKALDHDAIEAWKRITEKIVSHDGNYIAYKTEPWKGDTELFIYNSKGEKLKSFVCGGNASFTFDSKYLVFDMEPAAEEVRELRLKKTKKENMPLKSSVIYDIKRDRLNTIERSAGVKIPGKWAGMIAWQVEPEQGAKKESSQKGNTLFLLNTNSGDTTSFPAVTYYAFAKESPAVLFVSEGQEDLTGSGLFLYSAAGGEMVNILSARGDYKQLVVSDDAGRAAFLFNPEEEPAIDEFMLYYWDGKGEAEMIADRSAEGMPDGWIISENGRLQFSDNQERLFLGTAPAMPVKDTLRLDDEYPDVDIWHGTEGKLHTVQVLDKDRDKKRSWMAVVDVRSHQFRQLGTPGIPDISLIDGGDSEYVLGLSNVPYELQTMWEGSPEHLDIYLINIVSGEKKLLKKDIRASVKPSPAGRFISWYDYLAESVYAYEIATGAERLITSPEQVAVAREDNDIPNPAGQYRPVGWLEDDEKFLVKDRYDIWAVDPLNREEPVNLTINGRRSKISYSNIVFDSDRDYIKKGEELLLLGENEVTRESGYYSFKIGKPAVPVKIIGGAFSLSQPVRSSGASTIIYTRETFEIFPDLLVTDISFRKSIKISDVNPQQVDFNWGTAELYGWTSLDGKAIEGLLYKPADFDPSKKYPMIVNFYEKSSSELYSYKTPELHRSTVDYHYYTSNGYIIFNPDVYYETGYPGESAFNCVMPGITSLIGEGFVDSEHIGAQGHSWGGYQVAYLATRTDLFAAIESGAPVVNMFSAYGGIRWWSGLSRSFQYEHTQSRIGASIWESPLRYLENSPLFTMDKVTTPILIMHNDSDGHVPWYQGIEYFLALRRLGKPVWMLNYTGEPHWPQKLKNKKDFQIRMAQFFDHYLKDKPMPEWMDKGIPVIMKEYDLGYKPVEK